MTVACILILSSASAVPAQEQDEHGGSIPVATQMLFDSLTTTGRATVTSVFRIICRESKGTGFALDTGFLLTNAHVTEGCTAKDLKVCSATARLEPVVDLIVDTNRDLAVVRFQNKVPGGFQIDTRAPLVGVQVSTWGHPLAYNGPPPLLTNGYVSGFAYEPTNQPLLPRQSRQKLYQYDQ